MPEVNVAVDLHKKGDFSDSSLRDVREYLSRFSEVHFHQGFFPDSARRALPSGSRFSFVNLDVDIYESTLAGLKFFYPRMMPGGVIISHDYHSISCPGVKKAFDEFLVDKPEPLIELWDTQCLLLKQ